MYIEIQSFVVNIPKEGSGYQPVTEGYPVVISVKITNTHTGPISGRALVLVSNLDDIQDQRWVESGEIYIAKGATVSRFLEFEMIPGDAQISLMAQYMNMDGDWETGDWADTFVIPLGQAGIIAEVSQISFNVNQLEPGLWGPAAPGFPLVCVVKLKNNDTQSRLLHPKVTRNGALISGDRSDAKTVPAGGEASWFFDMNMPDADVEIVAMAEFNISSTWLENPEQISALVSSSAEEPEPGDMLGTIIGVTPTAIREGKEIELKVKVKVGATTWWTKTNGYYAYIDVDFSNYGYDLVEADSKILYGDENEVLLTVKLRKDGFYAEMPAWDIYGLVNLAVASGSMGAEQTVDSANIHLIALKPGEEEEEGDGNGAAAASLILVGGGLAALAYAVFSQPGKAVGRKPDVKKTTYK